MALAVTVSAQGASGTNTATTSAVTTTGGSGTAFVIAASFDPGVTPSSATDSKGNTYTLRASATNASGTGKTCIYVCEGGTGGASHTFTFTASGTAYPYVFGFEVTGIATSSAFDISVTGTDIASPWTISSGTLAQADEILISSIAGDFNNNAGVAVWVPGTGWTLIQGGSDFNNYWPGAVGYKIVSSTASDGPSWTIAGGGSASLAIISLKEASGGGPSVPDQLLYMPPMRAAGR